MFDLLMSWIVISIAVSLGELSLLTFAVALIAVGFGFVFHELAHRAVANRLGFAAYYVAWPWGLAMALLLAFATGGRVVFAAPGAVYVTPVLFMTTKDLIRREGIVSLAGPLSNVAVALAFAAMGLVSPSGLMRGLARLGFWANIWLAAFNMVPVPPLDGSKVFKWSKAAWAVVGLPLLAAAFLL